MCSYKNNITSGNNFISDAIKMSTQKLLVDFVYNNEPAAVYQHPGVNVTTWQFMMSTTYPRVTRVTYIYISIPLGVTLR